MPQYQSFPVKLCYHVDDILKIKEISRPINLAIVPCGRCNLNCEFCVSKKMQRIDLPLNKILHFLDVTKPKSVDITGGEPTLYKDLIPLIKYMNDHHIDAGMITNGIALKPEMIKGLMWIRISVNSYIDKGYSDAHLIEIEKNLSTKITYGFNYVYNINYKGTNFNKIIDFIKRHKFDYFRISLDINHTDELNVDFEKDILSFKDDVRFIFRRKIEFGPRPDECFIGHLKPNMESDGIVYRCVLESEELMHSIPIGDIDHPEKILQYQGMNHACTRCHNYEQNKIIKELLWTIILV